MLIKLIVRDVFVEDPGTEIPQCRTSEAEISLSFVSKVGDLSAKDVSWLLLVTEATAKVHGGEIGVLRSESILLTR
jgi:hypothetical protein